jgi:hypothetical protein
MAVKIDKEVLIKHHFWILTGLCVLLVLIPLVCLVGGVSGTVTKEAEVMAASKKKAQSISSSEQKNGKWVDAYKKQDDIVDSRRMVVWKQAWQTQRDFMTWPEGLLSEYPAFRTKQFGDPINTDEADKWGQTYMTQLRPVIMKMQPLEPHVSPLQENFVPANSDYDRIVQFKGDSWNGVLNLAHQFRADATPSREDVWLAQEDLWVKRELLAVIRAANDALSRFKEVVPEPPPSTQPAATAAAKDKAADGKTADGKDGKSAKSAKAPARPAAPVTDRNHKIFQNYFWKMDITLSRNASGKYLLNGTVTNIGKRRQPLGSFRVYLDNHEGSLPTLLHIDHEPLAVDETHAFKDVLVDEAAAIGGIYGVEQVLTWRTAVVKRLDDLRLDYNASRLAARSLVQPRWIEKAAPGDANAAPAPGVGSKPIPGEVGNERNTMAAMMGAGGSQGQTKNGFTLARYFDTNEQVRHMPVAMVVVVDEDFMHEFLGAFANCRLRMQTLQYHWHHVREKIKPQGEGGAAATTVASGRGDTERRTPTPGRKPADPGEATMGMRGPPMGGQGAAMRGGKGSMPMVGPGPMGGMGAGMAGMMGPGRVITQKEDEDEADMNLVELSVYGLASIYENPLKPATAAADATAPK